MRYNEDTLAIMTQIQHGASILTDRPFTIRPAVLDDAPTYNAFLRRLADEPNNGVSFHAGEFTATVDESREFIEKVIASDNQVIFMAVNADNVVIGDCSALSSQRLSRQHNVGLGISVDQDWRRLGIGRGLMNAVIAWADANPMVHRLELEVFEDNLKAINLYLQLGFTLEGRRRKAYRKHGKFKDAYMMSILFDRGEDELKS